MSVKLALIPVVEFSPYAFDKSERTSPGMSAGPDERRKFWMECLADSGIHGISPLEDSWHVPIEQLTQEHALKALVANHIKEHELDPGDELELNPLNGGYVLVVDGKSRVWPTCCGDLANSMEWKMAAAYREPIWKMVWIGHPWVSVRYINDKIEISEPHDRDEPQRLCVSTSPDKLAAAVDHADRLLDDFRMRVAKVLPELVKPELVEKVAKILTQGDR